ncbi:hypothetical protein [Pseudoduganella namucuonensis]|uniref:Uncharacterized protein n=1 Tax=Pseudoduganella namucuonensis TaxID=1035707 RepID=A0A1I7HG42_9BURK|nr:hypothetical protein [Pseudoduganella namucuonensis]SFU59509.1 hypothetical protein SAMN05216552_1005235 [Pseudoduganella namucuonensis]
MPVAIDQVESEVVVDGGGEQSGGANAKRNLPEPAAVMRWQQTLRQVQWDEARTSAVDYED